MSAIIAIVVFAGLFAILGVLLRGQERAPRCQGCDGSCGAACREGEAGEA